MYRHFLLTLLCCLSACGNRDSLAKLEGFAQGTTYHLTYIAPKGTDTTAVQNAINQEFARIDTALSNYRDDSAIEQFNAQKHTDPVAVDAELVKLVEIAREVNKASTGCYDLTIKPLFDLWGFKADVFTPPDPEALAQTLEQIGMDKLETLPGNRLRKHLPDLRIDISSIGQGYTVERIAQVLESFGVEHYLAEVGGELKVRGKKPDGKPWRIALEKPLPNERSLHKIISFDDGEPMALMTSGTYRHYFDQDGKRYSHILDARSGKPVEHDTVSVTILHPDPTLADAWSTALLCMGTEEGLAAADTAALAVLFIEQKNDELVEHYSRSLREIHGISFPEK
jgi:Membrane-associated lipoprotein involved in thiamine biosynthesis